MFNGVRSVADAQGKSFLVYLSTSEEFLDWHRFKTQAYYTTDCLIERIVDEDGKEVESVRAGGAKRTFIDYKVGEHITGEKTYYCRTVDDLLKGGHCISKNGKVVRRTFFEDLAVILGELGSEVSKDG